MLFFLFSNFFANQKFYFQSANYIFGKNILIEKIHSAENDRFQLQRDVKQKTIFDFFKKWSLKIAPRTVLFCKDVFLFQFETAKREIGSCQNAVNGKYFAV